MIKVRRIQLDTEHDNQKWLVYEGYVEGCPAVTKRRAINVAALVDGSLNVEDEKAHLVADVREYHERWKKLQEIE